MTLIMMATARVWGALWPPSGIVAAWRLLDAWHWLELFYEPRYRLCDNVSTGLNWSYPPRFMASHQCQRHSICLWDWALVSLWAIDPDVRREWPASKDLGGSPKMHNSAGTNLSALKGYMTQKHRVSQMTSHERNTETPSRTNLPCLPSEWTKYGAIKRKPITGLILIRSLQWPWRIMLHYFLSIK